MNKSVSTENQSSCPHCTRFAPCDCRERIGVYLPRSTFRQSWRLYRWYARELRNMGMANFINHARDIRLTFTPDLLKVVASAGGSPDFSVGLNHRISAEGVSLKAPKRTKTRCLRQISYSLTQCADNNRAPK